MNPETVSTTIHTAQEIAIWKLIAAPLCLMGNCLLTMLALALWIVNRHTKTDFSTLVDHPDVQTTSDTAQPTTQPKS